MLFELLKDGKAALMYLGLLHDMFAKKWQMLSASFIGEAVKLWRSDVDKNIEQAIHLIESNTTTNIRSALLPLSRVGSFTFYYSAVLGLSQSRFTSCIQSFLLVLFLSS